MALPQPTRPSTPQQNGVPLKRGIYAIATFVVEGNGREDMGGGVEEVTVRKRKGNMRQRVKRNETVSAPLSGKKTRRGDYINVLLFFFKPQLFR